MITYVDTSFLLKLLLRDEHGGEGARRLWLESEYVVCAEIGYVEARAALAAAQRAGRIDVAAHVAVKDGLDDLWAQVDRVPVTTALVLGAAELAEGERLRGYDAVHLAAALQARVTVLATADKKLLAAAVRNQLDIADTA